MKISVSNGYKEIGHGMSQGHLTPFLVTARYGGYAREYLVMAHNPIDATERLRSNVHNMMNEIKARLNPEDLISKVVDMYNEGDLHRASEYQEGISDMEDNLLELEDKTDELSELRKESIRENIIANREAIKKLRTATPTKAPSKFDRITARLVDIIAPTTTLTARVITDNRCYAVAYFDDPRDYVCHVE